MLTGKQKRHLRSLSQTKKAIIQIGKNGITDNLLKTIHDSLEAHELIKVSILQNCMLEKDDIANEITGELNCDLVQTIGNQMILYRQSKTKEKKDRIRLP